ncbi:TATA box-binding protein-associated factor RNA polymerase I subunit A [Hyperolius riggenbachi]|uniref:TATA box-binding protein-associated factor RNA polymerase I subunit A n=1 Tax=Hyperolius riggenbachi TaxID=752182 RepID=UPI0035A2FB8A
MDSDCHPDQSNEEEEELVEEHNEDPGIFLPVKPTDIYGTSKSQSITKSTSACYTLLHEAVCKNQWKRAAELLSCFVQTLEYQSTELLRRFAEVIWRAGNKILLNHPESRPEDMNVFNETMKNISVKKYLQISLEQAFYQLCSGQKEEAYRTLSVSESWRFGSISVAQEKLLKLVQAYKGLLDYQSWLQRRPQGTDSEMDYASRSSTSQDANSFSRQASIAFQEILQFPGVWDPFVLSYVELLESSGRADKAEVVLTEYAYNNKNPANPNAHVYLYEFKKRNGATCDALIKVLKVLHSLVPSHKLMLDYSKLLRKSELSEHQQLALQVVFDLLDYSGWKQNMKAWRCLANQLKASLRCGQTSWVQESWTSRRDWWPSYHFTKFHVGKDWLNSEELAVKKASVAIMLQGTACFYFKRVYILGSSEQRMALDEVKELWRKSRRGNPS